MRLRRRLTEWIERDPQKASAWLAFAALIPAPIPLLLAAVDIIPFFWLYVLFLAIPIAIFYAAHHFAREVAASRLSIYKNPGLPFSQDIRVLVRTYLSNHELHIEHMRFNEVATITDLVQLTTKTLYPSRGSTTEQVVLDARRYAYSAKYGLPWQDDEKIVFAKDLGSWSLYIKDFLAERGRNDLRNATVVDVGFGTGHAYEREAFFQSMPRIIAIDLSNTALNQAAVHFPNIDCRIDDAERLSTIESRSVDAYFSFRTYSSTLFDRRLAAHQAFRVLRPGGFFLVTIPSLYNDCGKPIHGLGDSEKRISPGYLDAIVGRTAKYFEMLGFSDLTIDSRSPFEVIVYGAKP